MASSSTFSKLLNQTEAKGSGDTFLILNALPVDSTIFDEILREVKWQEMCNRGNPVRREISIQGSILRKEDGIEIEPLYRHPADEQPDLVSWTPAVHRIKLQIEALLAQEVNHALIQLYRDGHDHIGEHSDKTLDILKNSNIINYSVGATRTMVLKNKETGARQRLTLPHNSLLIMGWRTNREWLHEIKVDKRPHYMKRVDERAFGGRRISLTFRTIATFYNRNTGQINGQGARKNMRLGDDKKNEKKQKIELIKAFGAENKIGNQFDWNKFYGRGFNVLNFKFKDTHAHQSFNHRSCN